MQRPLQILFMSAAVFCFVVPAAVAADRVKTANGVLEGVGEPNAAVRMFKGIPFAAPPVGNLRWREPQPAADWTGVREAKQFAARCMQLPLFGDMGFRANGMGEDCLYLNVWTPAKTAAAKLPVLVYFFGGGFAAGDGSEPRYDGESMARRGIIAVTVNYRLGIFGLFSHPELTKESPHHASGNYSLLDQNAALKWVRQNIAAFGGDPSKVTIAGESAGSIAVSAQVASPLSKGLFARAIGESGGIFAPTMIPQPLAAAEEAGAKLGAAIGAGSLAALRALSAEQLQTAASKPGLPRVGNAVIDGYFLPEPVTAIFAAGKQSHVPTLVGWNSEEQGARSVMGRDETTPENYAKAIHRLYPEKADEILKLYPGATTAEAVQSATDLASDRFIAFSTWKWADMQVLTGGNPVYRYYYSRPRPQMTAKMGNATAGLAGGVIAASANAPANRTPAPPATGAVHSAEIEYAMGNLAGNTVYDWTPDDQAVSKTMQAYFANFVKTGNPNGPGLPKWEPVNSGAQGQVMDIDVNTHAEPDSHRARYLFLDQLYQAGK